MVATAAALLEKCARLSARRWSGSAAALEEAHALRLHSEELVEHDVHAYLGFVEAVRSSQDLEDAQARTVEVPLEIARAAVKVGLLAEKLAAHGNPKLRADAVVAAILASAAAESAAFLVEINLGPVGDARSVEAQALALEALDLSRRLRPLGS